MLKKTNILLCTVALLSVCFPGWTSSGNGPRVGEQAPAFELESLIQAPPGTTPTREALLGRVVVLEFWATWCAPCVADFPHLNKLTKAFEDSGDVVFISITDEPLDKIEKFLKKHPLKTWVGIDRDRSAFGQYRVTGVPHAVIIDKRGKIAAITYPTVISESILRTVANGKPMNLPEIPSLPAGELTGEGGGIIFPDGMPQSIDEMNEFSLAKTASGKEHQILERLRGHWSIVTSLEPMIPGGSKTQISGEVTRKWVLGGRILQSHSIVKSKPEIERFAMLGYDVEKDQYFMDEYDPLDSTPKRWKGQWNEADSTLVFERAVTIRLLGGPPGEPGPKDSNETMAGSASQTRMTFLIDFGQEGEYESRLSLDSPDMSEFLPPGAMMAGNDSAPQVISESTAKRVDQ